MAEIGATLRETRMRARIDVSEIEAQTKIRAKYLRALENEEWDLLPGPTFVRSFLRTYAQALGLDDKALVDEYRRLYEQPVELDHQPPVMSPPTRRARPPSSGRTSRGYVIAVGAIGLLILLLTVGLLSQKKGGSPPSSARSNTSTGHHHQARAHHANNTPAHTTGASTRVALSLKPSASVWVCLIADGTRKAIPGVILASSYTPVTYHASHFTVTLGNDAVTLYVNGRPESVPTTSTSIGYSITSSGRRLLSASQQPTCK
ncbi:MAG TPA: helix-turn-helix transcriptional regulator [Solirubrobacteraceae bacterium]|nr:helix-turn-helix transcriptional regulator [Solirubrobacteraceae bacterium]